MAVDPPCQRPVAARLSVFDAVTGSVVATVDSGANGQFSVAVPPGQYVLRPVRVAGVLPPRLLATQVTVQLGHYTTITVRIRFGPPV